MDRQTFFLGDIVHCYRSFGICIGARTVCAMAMRDGVTHYQVEPCEDDAWYTAEQLTMAERPPEGMRTLFRKGQAVHCYSGDVFIAMRTVACVTVSEGEPLYYVTPTDTPWYAYRESALKPVQDFSPSGDGCNMVF